VEWEEVSGEIEEMVDSTKEPKVRQISRSVYRHPRGDQCMCTSTDTSTGTSSSSSSSSSSSTDTGADSGAATGRDKESLTNEVDNTEHYSSNAIPNKP